MFEPGSPVLVDQSGHPVPSFGAAVPASVVRYSPSQGLVLVSLDQPTPNEENPVMVKADHVQPRP